MFHHGVWHIMKVHCHFNLISCRIFLQPGHHLTYQPPKNKKDDWYSNYSIDIKYGLDHCSAQSVAFHYIKPQLMKRVHAILYGRCA